MAMELLVGFHSQKFFFVFLQGCFDQVRESLKEYEPYAAGACGAAIVLQVGLLLASEKHQRGTCPALKEGENPQCPG